MCQTKPQELSSWKGRGEPNFTVQERVLNLSVLLVPNVRTHSSSHSCNNDHPHNSSPIKGPQGGYQGGQGRQLQGGRGCAPRGPPPQGRGGVAPQQYPGGQPHQQGRGGGPL